MVYLPTFGLFFMVNVGKYASPMDPMELLGIFLRQKRRKDVDEENFWKNWKTWKTSIKTVSVFYLLSHFGPWNKSLNFIFPTK